VVGSGISFIVLRGIVLVGLDRSREVFEFYSKDVVD
jgi:hypothetical protein